MHGPGDTLPGQNLVRGWTVGNGKANIGARSVLTQAKLMKLYNGNFAPSLRLNKYPTIGIG